MREVRTPLAQALVWAVVAEFLLVRLLSRVGVYLPKGEVILTLYKAALLLGEVAFNLSLALAALLLALTLWQERWLVPVLLLSVGLLLGPVGALVVLLGSIPVLAGRALHRGAATGRVGLGLVLLAQTMRGLGVGLQRLWTEGALPGDLPGAAWLLQGAELAAILGPIVLVSERVVRGQLRSPSRRTIGAAAAAVLGLAAAVWAQPDLTGVLAMFSLGFSLSWPPVLYLLAAGGAVMTLGTMRGESRLGLLLLFLAGLGLNVNQQLVVVMAGWALLAQSPAQSVEVRLRDAV